MALDADIWTVVGRIVAPHGVKGEVRIYPDSDFPERFTTPGDRWLRTPNRPDLQPLTLVSGRFLEGKGLYVVKFAEINQRYQAEAIRQGELLVPARDRPPLTADEFYVQDLVGLQVRLVGSEQMVGRVVDVFSAGNDLLAVELAPAGDSPEAVVAPPPVDGSPSPGTVETAKGEETNPAPRPRRRDRRQTPKPQPPKLVPFVHAIVPRVNLAEGWVEIAPPPGLLD